MKPFFVRVGRKMVSTLGLEVGVGVGDLELVLEVGRGAQAAHDDARAASACRSR